MLDTALDAGITAVDTANAYAGGATEEILGELLPGRRDRIVLATKAGMPHPDAGEHAPLSAAGLRAALEGSLRRLEIDHVDLFYLHQPDRRDPARRDPGARWPSSSPRARSRASACPTSPPGRSARSTTSPTRSARRGPSSPSSSTTCSPAGSRRSTWSSPAPPVCSRWSTTRSAAACSPAGTRFEQSPRHRAGSATPGSPPMYTDRYWDPQLFAAVAELDAGSPTRPASPSPSSSLRWLLGRDDVGAVLLGGSEARAAAGQPRRRPKPDRCPPTSSPPATRVGAALRGPMPAYNR